MKGTLLYVLTGILIVIILIIVLIVVLKKKRKNYYLKLCKNLDTEKNLIGSTPVLLELSKLEPIIKNEKMEEKYQKIVEECDALKQAMLRDVFE